jgi:hypothetical protein
MAPKKGGRADLAVRESSGGRESQFVFYCPFNPNVILPCVGEQGSTEEGGLTGG